MNEMRSRIMLVGMAAGLCLLAACSAGTGDVRVVGDTPAPMETAEPMATPAEAMPTPAPAPAPDPQLTAAVNVAQQWIALVDQGQYAESWSASGKLFQANMQQQQWVQTLTGARMPLGSVVSREVAGSEIRESLPGAPAGRYALVSFATNFENKPDIIETVTMILEEDGQFRVVGYSSNPRSVLEQQQGQPAATPTPTPPQV